MAAPTRPPISKVAWRAPAEPRRSPTPPVNCRRISGSIAPTSGVWIRHEVEQVAGVLVALHPLGEPHQVLGRDIPLTVRDLFRAADHLSLPRLDRLDEGRSPQERLVGAGVEPGKAPAELFDMQLAPAQIGCV